LRAANRDGRLHIEIETPRRFGESGSA